LHDNYYLFEDSLTLLNKESYANAKVGNIFKIPILLFTAVRDFKIPNQICSRFVICIKREIQIPKNLLSDYGNTKEP